MNQPNLEVDDFIAHFGVKGMHWGVRKSTADRIAKTDRKIARTKAKISEHEQSVKNIKTHIKDANDNGVTAELFKKKYGSGSPALFSAVHGMSRTEALDAHKADLQDELADHDYARQVNVAHLGNLQRRRERLSHKLSVTHN